MVAAICLPSGCLTMTPESTSWMPNTNSECKYKSMSMASQALLGICPQRISKYTAYSNQHRPNYLHCCRNHKGLFVSIGDVLHQKMVLRPKIHNWKLHVVQHHLHMENTLCTSCMHSSQLRGRSHLQTSVLRPAQPCTAAKQEGSL